MIIDDQKIDVPYLMKITHLDEEDNKQYLSNVAETLIRDDMVIFLIQVLLVFIWLKT